jgi:regulator of RNase E activity RraB
MAVDNDSTEQAHKLTLDMFGTSEEVQRMAIMELNAGTRKEARDILVKLVNKPLKSKAGVEATVSKKSIEKILSGKSADKSYNAKAHFLAAANIEKLFSNAVEPFKFAFIPHKRNENYQEVKRLYAPMAFENRIIPVKFTVMVMLNEKEGKRIYSIEAIDVDLEKK